MYSLVTTPAVSFSDYLLTSTRGSFFSLANVIIANPSEVQTLTAKGVYSQLCAPFGGTNVFCVEMTPDSQSGPFIIYSVNIYGNLTGLYRCLESMIPSIVYHFTNFEKDGTSRHFISTDPKCEGDTTEGMYGYISPIRGRETFRALYLRPPPPLPQIKFDECRYRCLDHSTGAHYHSLDLVCPPSDTDAGLLGYVH